MTASEAAQDLPLDAPPPVLVLGLGNVLCGDDGLGVEAVRRLERAYECPDSVLLLDGGTLGLSLLAHLKGATRVVMVDAVRADEPPGSLVRLTGDEVAPAVRERLSAHQIGVADLLDGLRLLDAYPRELVLVGLVPATLELGLERSPAVEAGLPELVEAVAREVGRLGFPLSRTPLGRAIVEGRTGDGLSELWSGLDLARAGSV